MSHTGIIRSNTVKTRKPHQCWGCTKLFPPKTEMLYVLSKDCGDIFGGWWCSECMKLDTFGETEFGFGELNQMNEEMNEQKIRPSN